jgi:hypothetical protein
MPSRKLIRLAILTGACLLPAACATTSYSRSGVAAVPPGVKGKAGSSATLEIEGLKVRLESLDYARREATIPSYGLRLVFDPRELGYSFDPAQVVLRDASGATWRPRVYGPGQFAAGAWSCTGAGVTSASAPSYHPRSTWQSVPGNGSSFRSLAWRGDRGASTPSRCRSSDATDARSTACTGSRCCWRRWRSPAEGCRPGARDFAGAAT